MGRILALLLIIMPAWALSPPDPRPGRIAAPRDAGTVDVRDFGAMGDGMTDDAAALNAAMDHLRAGRGAGGGLPGISLAPQAARLVIPPGRYLVRSSLNWTGLTSLAVEIDCQGCLIDGRTAGTPVVDALGSRFLRIGGLTILANAAAPPSIGLQIGRIASGQSADNHHIRDLTIAGHFTLAALYDLAAETTTFDHMQLWNQSPSPTAHTLILDGLNHFAVGSAFATQTIPPDTPQSFNEALFINPSIMRNGGAPAAGSSAVWMAATARARFLTAYIAHTDGGYGATLYATGAVPIVMLDMDAHFENAGLSDVFHVDGPPGTKQVTLRGLRYMDSYPQHANSVFKVSPNVGTVVMADAEIRIDNFYRQAARLFDNPAIWRVTGRYAETSGNHWNLPDAQFQGFIDVLGHVSTPRLALSGTNPSPMALTVPSFDPTGSLVLGNDSLTAATGSGRQGRFNLAIGRDVLSRNTTGSGNIGVGRESLHANTEGTDNTVVGDQAARQLATGSRNTILGAGAAAALTAGSGNILIGAGGSLATGSGNIFIGNDLAAPASGHALNIGGVLTGNLATGALAINAAPIRTLVGVPTSPTAACVPGQSANDRSHHYECVAPDTWRRTPHTPWATTAP